MTYLGFAGTVGACPTVDFQISDAWVVPAEIAPQHCERLVRAAATRPRLIGGVFACRTRLDRLDRFGLSQKRSRPRKVRVGVCRRVGGWEACQFGGLGWSGAGPADRVRGVLRPHRSRKQALLRTYQPPYIDAPFSAAAAAPISRAQAGLPVDAVVFVCFNRNAKIDAAIFGAWMKILSQATAHCTAPPPHQRIRCGSAAMRCRSFRWSGACCGCSTAATTRR